MTVADGPGRPRKDEARETLRHVGFKADAETVAALDRLVKAMAPLGGGMRPKSAVLRRLILEAAAALPEEKKGKRR